MARRSPQNPTIRSAFAAFAEAKPFSVPSRPQTAPAPEPTMELSPPATPLEPPPQTFQEPPVEPLYALDRPETPPASSSKLRDLHNRLTNPQLTTTLDWRAALAVPIQEQNIDAIKQAGVIPAQFKVLELSQEAESEQLQFQASQFILAQNGHGAIQKTEQKVEYEQVPVNQLIATIRAKLQKIRGFNPDFDLSQIIEIPAAIETAPDPS